MPPAPRWIADAETKFTLPRDVDLRAYCSERGVLLPDIARAKGPGDEEFIRRHHDLGVPVLSYITFSNRRLEPDERSFPGAFRLADAPELAIYDEKSVRERSIFADQDDPRRLDICSNTPALVEAMLREVRAHMEAGLDGLFLDHPFGVTRCFGEEFGIHDHIYHHDDIADLPEDYLRFAPGREAPCDDPLGNYAYAMLLNRAQQVMDEYGPGKTLMLNTTFWPFYYSSQPIPKFVMYAPHYPRTVPGVYWEHGHSCLLESFIVVPAKLIRPDTNSDQGIRWQDFDRWMHLAETPPQRIAEGKRQVALPYFGAGDQRDNAYFCFAAAKLADLIWWSGPAPPGGEFCGFRLGRPADPDYLTEGEVRYRRYPHGFVACNPTDAEHKVSVEIPQRKVEDLYEARARTASSGRLEITLPPQSGRVYLYNTAPRGRA